MWAKCGKNVWRDVLNILTCSSNSSDVIPDALPDKCRNFGIGPPPLLSKRGRDLGDEWLGDEVIFGVRMESPCDPTLLLLLLPFLS